MRALLLGAALALFATAAIAADATEEEVMATRYGNTTDTVDAFGVHTKIYYNADHTFKANSAGLTVEGTWKLKGHSVCLTYFKPPAESCSPIKAQQVGDSWVTGVGALQRKVTLKKGIQ
ncbi:MAG TPA: hypothetical protein VHL34_08575 [Rhizomicrobium sp.]|jgi:hypothetical protein|nr:hypothetical protein [Rhizomicrobium sp.]